MDISIGDNHLDILARHEHVGQHLQTEQARLVAELRYVSAQVAALTNELTVFLQRNYGVDAQHVAVTLDTARGVIIVPDVPDAPVESASPSADAPADAPHRARGARR